MPAMERDSSWVKLVGQTGSAELSLYFEQQIWLDTRVAGVIVWAVRK
jgi:hypothetical protein